jgi:two-component system LytT family response regulator/two-component system response regulator LytT
LKPFNEERIKKTLGKLNTSIKGQLMTSTVKQESIPVHSEGRTYFLYPEEILYIESSRANILIKTSHREFRLKASLTDWEQRLAPFGFVASHRSYLVNTKEIKEISRYGYSYNLRLKSGHNIPLSRSCARKIKKNLSSL